MGNVMERLFPSKYFKASDFEQPRLLTIAGVQDETMQDGKVKGVVYVEEDTKGIVINKTNTEIIVALHGLDDDRWPGKKIVAGTAKVRNHKGELVDGITLRGPKNKSAIAAKHSFPKPTVESEDPTEGMDEIPF